MQASLDLFCPTRYDSYMTTAKPINLSALSEHRKILRLWLSVVAAGLLIFAGMLLLSYFVLNAPSLVHEAARYRRAEQALGITELGGVALSVLAYFRYLTIKNNYHDLVFDQFVKDNGWTAKERYSMDKVASTLLSVGESYEQGFGFGGVYDGHPFSCLIFEYIATDSKTRRFICLSFHLSKAYPMILIDNKRNNHRMPGDTDPMERIPKGVELRLEGDFNHFYHVSMLKGEEKEAMIILSPDFMVALEDHASDKVDVEIGNKRLFLVYDADYYSERNIKSIFGVAEVVLAKIDKVSKTWLASSSNDEKQVVALRADAARRSMIFRPDWYSAIVALVSLVVFVILMISHVQTEPPCTPSDPCYTGGGVYTGT